MKEEVKTASAISPKELVLEKGRLKHTVKQIRKQLSEMGQELFDDQEKAIEFKKYIWDSKQEFDPTELRAAIAESESEVYMIEKKNKYFQNLYKVQGKPYFGSIIFKENDTKELVYIGITHVVEGEFEHLVNDWRSPICSLFYDYEVGPAAYEAPMGIIKGELQRKRQYKLENGQMIHVFDNSINVDDELLQSVLASDGTEKMKNIVNTIQQEQNRIIRNISDRNLIVQGIAGSGKTSVALHRIAFLLYKLEYLSSNNVLIFSPNDIFTEYISEVLPELGEKNTMQTTFNDFINTMIRDDYEENETFVDFISRFYKDDKTNYELIKYKQSDAIIKDVDGYINALLRLVKFTKDIELPKFYISVNELNEMFLEKYSRLPIFNRLDAMAERLSERMTKGRLSKKTTFLKKLKESINLPIDFKKIYSSFFSSKYCQFKLTETEIKAFVNTGKISYEDSVLFTYIKGCLAGFDYNNNIKQIIVDEAQDYSKIEYIILSKIFKTSGFTILGDVNQTINPYYKYDSLDVLNEVLEGRTTYLELTKTYRSSQEIIEYSNKVLGLTHVNAIRASNNTPVIEKRETSNIKDLLLEDIKYLQSKYNSVAIITKSDDEAEFIYDELKEETNINIVTEHSVKINKKLLVIPSYLAKGLEFDSVIVYTKKNNAYTEDEKYLFYVSITRSQHELIVYNN